MGIYKKGNTYWMIKQYRGKRIERSLDTKVKRVAEEQYAKIVSEIIDHSYFEGQKAKTLTLADMVEKYKQKYLRLRDETTFKRLLPAFGHLTLAEITTEMISDYRDSRLKVVKPATAYQELSLLRRMFNVARREWKWVKENPAAVLSFPFGNSNARARWLTLAEEQSLLSAATNPQWLGHVVTAPHQEHGHAISRLVTRVRRHTLYWNRDQLGGPDEARRSHRSGAPVACHPTSAARWRKERRCSRNTRRSCHCCSSSCRLRHPPRGSPPTQS